MPEKAKARIDPRVRAEFRVDLEYPWGSGRWIRARSIDLSASGIHVGSDQDLPLKAQLGCRIHLPAAEGSSGQIIHSQAIVIRVNRPEDGSKEWRYGLYFVELAEPDAEALRRFVFALA